jgi:adenosylhomocysteine nucleosidase
VKHPYRLLVVLMLFAVLIGAVPVSASDAPTPDRAPRIAILGAYAPEWSYLLADIQHPRTVDVNGMKVVLGELRGKKVLAALTGVSMVNAAMSTTQILERFNVTRIIMLGVSGGVDANPADVAVPAEWMQWLETHWAHRNPDGTWNMGGEDEKCSYGEFTGYPPMFVCRVSVTSVNAALGQRVPMFKFQTDPQMLAIAQQVASTVQLQQCADDPQGGHHCVQTQPQVIVGRSGVSGPAFVDDPVVRDWIATNPSFDSPTVLDMETAAVYQVAFNYGVPVIAFRPPSDLAGASPTNEWTDFQWVAAKNGTLFLYPFLDALPN